MSGLIHSEDVREVTAMRRLYRRLARTSDHLANVAERFWYAVLKASEQRQGARSRLARCLRQVLLPTRRWSSQATSTSARDRLAPVGAVARVLLRTTAEALMHDAACPIRGAPRPVDLPGLGGARGGGRPLPEWSRPTYGR